MSNSGVLDLVKICLTSFLIGSSNEEVKKRILSGDFMDGGPVNGSFEEDGKGGYVKRLTGSCHCKSVSFVVRICRVLVIGSLFGIVFMETTEPIREKLWFQKKNTNGTWFFPVSN